jgi:aminoglycoside 6'-N-acetyltransferase
MEKMPPDIPTRLETERLYLRPYQPGDGAMYFAVSQKNRDHLMRYESNNAIMSIHNQAEAEELVRELAEIWETRQQFFLGAFKKDTDEFVAQVYIRPVSWELPEFAIGYFVDCDHEGQGYITEAVHRALRFIFEHLNAHRVRLECDDMNLRSLRVAERCGMVKEGHIRENKRHTDGAISGTLYYGLLRNEYP